MLVPITEMAKVGEAARFLDLSKQAIENRINRGKLKAFKLRGVNYVDMRQVLDTESEIDTDKNIKYLSQYEVSNTLGLSIPRIRVLIHKKFLWYSAIDFDSKEFYFLEADLEHFWATYETARDESHQNKVLDHHEKMSYSAGKRIWVKVASLENQYRQNPSIVKKWKFTLAHADKHNFSDEEMATHWAMSRLQIH